ncbi:E3 ubiquitin-protein ligase RHF2A [Zea mays]|uniref:E3 ubiquitin-protein ligase RHF2A n=1 Tax=Zea mays TaxID=4577 RepID=A0A1D6MFD6_MAIZE|nr:E3 ubiquitin-protein ligase RHF2A [Zea mays]
MGMEWKQKCFCIVQVQRIYYKEYSSVKEKLFSRNSSMANLGSKVRREVNARIASVSRMMERLETSGNSRTSDRPTTSTFEVPPATKSSNERVTESNSDAAIAGGGTTTTSSSASNFSAPCVAMSGSN